MYGKLKDGKFMKAKKAITIINPTDEMYEMCGYKKLVEPPMPELEENEYVEISYEETETEIIKHYEVKTQEEV